MLFSKALRRELANAAGVVFAALFTIMLTTTLIRLLGRAAGGSVDTASVLPLIVFSAFNTLSVLLVLTLFIAVLMVISRQYADSEMVVWFASGQGPGMWIKPVLTFSIPFVVLVSVVAFGVAPWANRQSAEYRQRFDQRDDLSQLAAGQFRESVKASRVFFVEDVSTETSEVSNVFVSQKTSRGDALVVANKGRIEQRGSDRFLVLEQGRRYDTEQVSALKNSTTSAAKVLEFERYGLRLDPQTVTLAAESSKNKSTMDLLRNPGRRDLGELLWRISLPLSAILLSLLAIPLAYVNPRVGRSVNLLVAILLYVVYNSALSLSQASVNSGKLSFAVAVWLAHAGMLVLIALLYLRRARIGGTFGLMHGMRSLFSRKRLTK